MSLKKFNASKDKPTNDDEQCNSGSKPSTAQSYTHLQDKCHVSLVMFGGDAQILIVILKAFSSLSYRELGKLSMHVQERILSGSRF